MFKDAHFGDNFKTRSSEYRLVYLYPEHYYDYLTEFEYSHVLLNNNGNTVRVNDKGQCAVVPNDLDVVGRYTRDYDEKKLRNLLNTLPPAKNCMWRSGFIAGYKEAFSS